MKGALEVTTTTGKITVGGESTPYTMSGGSSTNIHTTTGAIEINGVATSSGDTTVETTGAGGTITVKGKLLLPA